MPYVSSWTPLTLPRHADRTLPQVLWLEPGYVFWAFDKGFLNGLIGAEAEQLLKLARSIRLPRGTVPLAADYIVDRAGRLVDMEISLASTPRSGMRLDRIDLGAAYDLSRPRRDLTADKLLVRAVKTIVFGSAGARVNRRRAEQFFEEPDNFIAP